MGKREENIAVAARRLNMEAHARLVGAQHITAPAHSNFLIEHLLPRVDFQHPYALQILYLKCSGITGSVIFFSICFHRSPEHLVVSAEHSLSSSTSTYRVAMKIVCRVELTCIHQVAATLGTGTQLATHLLVYMHWNSNGHAGPYQRERVCERAFPTVRLMACPMTIRLVR